MNSINEQRYHIPIHPIMVPEWLCPLGLQNFSRYNIRSLTVRQTNHPHRTQNEHSLFLSSNVTEAQIVLESGTQHHEVCTTTGLLYVPNCLPYPGILPSSYQLAPPTIFQKPTSVTNIAHSIVRNFISGLSPRPH